MIQTGQNAPIKIRRIEIHNYRGIDQLELEFPAPRMAGDPDILIMGSENGLGKTSVLECCSLLLLAFNVAEGEINEKLPLRNLQDEVNIADLLIRTDCPKASIVGDFVFEAVSTSIQIEINRQEDVIILSGNIPKVFARPTEKWQRNFMDTINNICSPFPDSVIANGALFFHSYRKIQEGGLDLAEIMERSPEQIVRRPRTRHWGAIMSKFKLNILRALMMDAGLFEMSTEENQNPKETLGKLDEIMKLYTGVTISGQLKTSPTDKIDLRIKPSDGAGSFSFDGLSSGQKEIISTLFLIWEYTKNRAAVVLIDEPELHLNAQWHKSFVHKLVELAPQNQYIMATHSQDIMGSVSEEHRVLLLNDQEG